MHMYTCSTLLKWDNMTIIDECISYTVKVGDDIGVYYG